MKEYSLAVRRFATRVEMGAAAASDIVEFLRARLAQRSSVRAIFAAAPSQNETLAALLATPGVDWARVVAFHMDEYIGLASDAPQRFGNWLKAALFSRAPFGRVNYILPEPDVATCIAHYVAALNEAPIDAVCLGVGVNGHLAFNDPPVADFADPDDVKIVELDPICRQQQVDDGAFRSVADMPTHAVTLTIPRLLRADRLFCVAPGPQKREAVRRAMRDPIGEACPATALRLHPDATLYLDADSGAGL